MKTTWITTLTLLAMFGLALSSMVVNSPTLDEQGFITRGLGYLRNQNRHMRVGHPLGLNALNAALLVSDDQVRLPTDDPSWSKSSFHRPSELFLWEIGNDVAHIMFLARLPTIWLGMLLAALAGRWAKELSGNRWAGFMALAFIAFDPNILAHTRLTTTDLGLAAGAALAGYTLWRFLRRPSWSAIVIAGVGLGLLQNTKFTAALFVPLFALVLLIALLRQWGANIQASEQRVFFSRAVFPWSFMAQLSIVYPLVAFLTLWAAYGFQIAALPDNLPTFPQLSGLTLPLAHHIEQLLDIGGRLQKSTPAFLLGQYSDQGWWYYFPIAFLLKTPLPLLIMLPLTVALRINLLIKKRRLGFASLEMLNWATLLIPALGYFAIALTTDINLGYRHLLPLLPFFAISLAYGLSIAQRARATVLIPLLSSLSVGWMAASTLMIHPHYLSYFNQLAGGPDNGWRALVDSNIDWGQDLGALKKWMVSNEVDRVWLSYFGEARPDYYGIEFQGLDSFPPRLMNPKARPFYPSDPAPGIYAISATNLQGVLFNDHDQFAWFRERLPLAKIGYSIFIYQVPPRGVPADLILSGLQLDEIAPADYALLGTNDVSAHWFDAGSSFLEPSGKFSWWAAASGAEVNSQWQAQIATEYRPVVQRPDYSLLQREPNFIPPGAAAGLEFTTGDGRLALLSVELANPVVTPGSPIELATIWRQEGSPQPVKIFIHAVGPNGDVVAQWDGLSVVWEGWRLGDVLYQVHQLNLPDGAVAGSYQLWAGLYHPATDRRWQTVSGDRHYLGEVAVEPND